MSMTDKARVRPTLAAALCAMMFVIATGAGTRAADESGSGLPVPRFVSLKADKVNVRNGPNKNQDVTWVFSRAGLPVEITAEFETWRRIRDAEGSEGWVYHSMLSGRRTALVAPWNKSGTVALRAEPRTDSRVTAQLERGVIGALKTCDGKWCRFLGQGFDGYVEQNELWGVYPNEKVE